MEAASHYRYFNEFSLALETGMRIGEIIGLEWSDIDFMNRTIYVNRTLVYIKSDDKDSPNFDKCGFEFHEPNHIIKKEREKIAPEIIRLTDELLKRGCPKSLYSEKT